jgi:hypothetical protein
MRVHIHTTVSEPISVLGHSRKLSKYLHHGSKLAIPKGNLELKIQNCYNEDLYESVLKLNINYFSFIIMNVL